MSRSSTRTRLLFTIFRMHVREQFLQTCSQVDPSSNDHRHRLNITQHRMHVYAFSPPIRGLICRQMDSKVVIANPSTGQLLTLPRVKTIRRGVLSFLGYDPMNDLYKVLCMTVLGGHQGGHQRRSQVVSEEHQVYTLGGGQQKWRMIECEHPHLPPPTSCVPAKSREKVQQFLNAAITGNLEFLKNVANQLDEGKGLKQTVESVKDANKRGALHFAAREGQTEICRYLLEELKLDANTKDEAGDTPLVHAARQGQIDTAKYLLDHGADPNIASELGATALHHAAGTGNIELVKELLSRGVPVDSESESGTPLIWAAGHDQKDAVEVLLEHNANPNAETEDNVTPLLSAVAAGSVACLELLVKAGAKANVFAGGATPLHIAADIGDLELINCLLKAGADPNQKDEEGNRALEVAALRENRKIVETLFPLTTKPESVSEWTVDGVLAHVESNKEQEENSSSKEKSGESGIKKDLPEVSPEAKAKAAEAKARGQDAFHRKDYQMAIDAYTQAIDFDPTDHTLLSNRSICWLRLGQAEHALSDAKACRELKPDWPKGCFREGAALRLLQRFDEAANAFYEGVLLSPESKELIDAFREAVDAGRKFHGKDKITDKS
ncbi:unnamed protein product [Brassica napus]|nr:unnamed protein product [Brassica napus]